LRDHLGISTSGAGAISKDGSIAAMNIS